MEMLKEIIFYMLAVLAVYSAARAVLGLNLMRSLMHFGVFLITIAGFFYILQADFLALSELIVYAGGILVLMLFAVMLEPEIIHVPRKANSLAKVIGYLLPFTFFLFLNYSILNANLYGNATGPECYSLERLGWLMLSDYLLPFEVLGAVLLVAAIGAVWIIKERKENDG